MAELNCRCLNVTVHLDSTEVQFTSPVKPLDLLIDSKAASTIADLHEVKLGATGITTIHKCLIRSRQSGDWIIHNCTNCDTDTHITHCVKGEDKVFVTDKIETDAGRIEVLRRSEKFSRVFNVVLSDVTKDETADHQRVFAMSLGNNDPAVNELHQQMKQYLNEEEAALEQRIMDFEKEQREAFSRLRNKVHKERSLIFKSLAKARPSSEEGLSQQEKGQADMEFIAKSGPSLVMGQSLSSGNNSSSSSSPGRQSEVTIMLQDKPVGAKSPKEDAFEDALFGMDGIDGDDHDGHFIQLDDDDDVSTSTDDSYREELTHSSHTVNVAQSLPITVPLYTTYSSRQQQPSEHQDEKIHIAPSQMAESIKALALSVHQETEIFGDLPKPRTNSFTWAR